MSLNCGRNLTNDEIGTVSGGECLILGLGSPITVSLAGTFQSVTYTPPIWVICRNEGFIAALPGKVIP